MRLLPVAFLICLSILSASAQKNILRLDPYEIGMYDTTGRALGIWNYFDEPGDLALTIDYKNLSILYIKTPQPSAQIVNIAGAWSAEEVRRQARFLGSNYKLLSHYYYNGALPLYYALKTDENFRLADKTIFWLTFEVNPAGRAENPKVINGGKEVEKILLEAFAGAPNIWIPAVNEAQKEISAKFTIPFCYCRNEHCPTEMLPQPDSLTQNGQVLFTVPVARNFIKNVYALNDQTIKMGWTANSEYIILKKSLNRKADQSVTDPSAILYKLDKNGKIIKTYLITENSNIVCTNDSCSDFIFAYANHVSSFVAHFTGKFNSLNFSNATGLFNPAPHPTRAVAAINQYTPKETKLMLWDWNKDELYDLPVNSNPMLQPVRWLSDSTLLCSATIDYSLNMLAAVNINTGNLKMLPYINARLWDVAPDGRHLLLATRQAPYTNYKLYSFDLQTFTDKELSKGFREFRAAFYGRNKNEIFFLDGPALYFKSLSSGRQEKLINGVSHPVINPQRNAILYIVSKTNSIYLYDIDTHRIKQFFNLNQQVFYQPQ